MTVDTKERLAQCLKELMKSKPLDKITISALTKNAEVNRQTFYYHFDNIFDLLKWTVDNEATYLLKNRKDDLFWKEGILELLYYLQENREFAINAFDSLRPEEFMRFFYQDVAQVIREFMYSNEAVLKEDKSYLDFLTLHFTISLAGIAISWLKGDISLSAEDVVKMIDRAITEQKVGYQTIQSLKNKSTFAPV